MTSPTLEELLKMTDSQLRQTVTQVLEPGTWEHKAATSVEPGWGIKIWGYCERCKGALEGECAVPPEANGSWPDIAERLREKVKVVEPKSLSGLLATVYYAFEACDDTAFWFAFEATARDRVICLLLALLGDKESENS